MAAPHQGERLGFVELVLSGAGQRDLRADIPDAALRHHAALPGSELHVIDGAPHGCNVSHADEFNQTLLGFLAR